MKKSVSRFIQVLLLSAGVWAGTSCSDDDDIPVPDAQPTRAQLFSGSYSGRPYMPNVLKLKFGDADLFGRDADFSVDDSCKWASVTLYRVFPGEPKVTIDSLPLVPADIDTVSMRITNKRGTTPMGTSYLLANASVEEGMLALELLSVTYAPNEFTEISNWWAPAPFDDATYSGCMHMKWHVPAGTYVFPNEGAPADTIVIAEGEEDNPLGIMDMVPMLANQILPMFLRDINLDPSAMLRAHYASDAFSGGPTWQYSPQKNLCQYYVADGRLHLVLNAEEIIAEVMSDQTKAGTGPGITTEQIWVVLEVLNKAMTDGIPLGIIHNGDEAGSVTVYLTWEQLRPVLGLLPLVKGLVGSGDDMIGSLVGSLLDTFTRLIQISDNIEIGLNLVPAGRPSDI